jgi:broad specificity phosphatase PhoE
MSTASSKPTRVLLIRHGGTTASKDDRFAGSMDVELSDLGRQQVARLGERLANEVPIIAAVYCSDMKRARDTAMAVASPHGLVPQIVPELREIDHGRWEGQVHKEVEQRDADAYAAWSADPLTIAPPGGETGLSVLARSAPALRKLVAAHAGQTIVVVSHKATNRLLIAYTLGMDVRRYRDRIAQDLACLNVLEFSSPTEARLITLNDTTHCGEPS